MQPNFESIKRQKLNAAKIVCLTLYNNNFKFKAVYCFTVLMQISIFRDKPSENCFQNDKYLSRHFSAFYVDIICYCQIRSIT